VSVFFFFFLYSYHSVEPPVHITNDLISYNYHDEDDETIRGVVTVNPHTHSPPSQRLTSSSSSSSTASSASTVLLSHNNVPTLPTTSNITKKPPNTNGNLTKTNNKTVSQLPKRTITTPTINVSRLKQPSKIVPSSSKLKPPSSTITKPVKSMIANSTPSATITTMPASSMRKATGITTQSSTMANNAVNKTTQQHVRLYIFNYANRQYLKQTKNKKNKVFHSFHFFISISVAIINIIYWKKAKLSQRN
jgi:hypothetical protein